MGMVYDKRASQLGAGEPMDPNLEEEAVGPRHPRLNLILSRTKSHPRPMAFNLEEEAVGPNLILSRTKGTLLSLATTFVIFHIFENRRNVNLRFGIKVWRCGPLTTY